MIFYAQLPALTENVKVAYTAPRIGENDLSFEEHELLELFGSGSGGAALCDCGHVYTLHDTCGCVAFLGGFPATAHIKRYCECAAFVAHTERATEPLIDEVSDAELLEEA